MNILVIDAQGGGIGKQLGVSKYVSVNADYKGTKLQLATLYYK